MRRTQILAVSVVPLVGGMFLAHPMGIATVTEIIVINIVSPIAINTASVNRMGPPHMADVVCHQRARPMEQERASVVTGAAWVGALVVMVVVRGVSRVASAAIAHSIPTFLVVRQAKDAMEKAATAIIARHCVRLARQPWLALWT